MKHHQELVDKIYAKNENFKVEKRLFIKRKEIPCSLYMLTSQVKE
jgi:hypothetical protein